MFRGETRGLSVAPLWPGVTPSLGPAHLPLHNQAKVCCFGQHVFTVLPFKTLHSVTTYNSIVCMMGPVSGHSVYLRTDQ